jgi:voltage-gated potassium channel
MGKAPPLSFFHAFYFISYTATTIGFGEIPSAFSDAQRMWVTICIYLTGHRLVVFDCHADRAAAGQRLPEHADGQPLLPPRSQLKEPFYLVCGCGETGNLICRTFDRTNQAFVVIEKDELRVQELDLQDFKTDTPALAADARIAGQPAAGRPHAPEVPRRAGGDQRRSRPTSPSPSRSACSIRRFPSSPAAAAAR